MSNNKKDVSKVQKPTKARITNAGAAKKNPLPHAKSTKVTIPPEIARTTVPEPSQYEAHADRIAPLLHGKPLADLDSVEVAVLAKKAKLKPVDLTRLVNSAKLAKQTDLPAKLFFALSGKKPESTLSALFESKPEELRARLTEAARGKKVSASVSSRLADLEALRPMHEPLKSFAGRLGIKVTSKFLNILERKNIHTLAEVRKAGGIERITGAPVTDSGLQLLDAHANLSILSVDADVNAKVIGKGFKSVFDIAAVPREKFAAVVAGKIESSLALQMYDQAFSRLLVARHDLSGVFANLANGYELKDLPDYFRAKLPQKCHCSDCESAVSPMAYLADLLDYSTKHLSHGSVPGDVDASFLERTFHQPFGRLPATCSSMEEPVRQARIAIEVLRADLLPVAYWNFDKLDQGKVPDVSGHGHHGTLKAAKLGASGKFSGTVELDGKRGFVDIDSSRIFARQSGSDMTIAAWIFPTGQGSDPNTGGTIACDTDSYTFARFPKGTIQWSAESTGNKWVDSGFVAQEKVWSHVAFVYSPGAVLIYGNGKLVHRRDNLSEDKPRNPRFTLGSRNGTDQFFEGRLDEIVVFDRALDPQYIAALANGQLTDSVEAAYRLKTYDTLLGRLGTSFDELRRAKGFIAEQRQALADRLGIAESHLDDLVLDPSDPLSLTEARLEELFGLRDTHRDPISHTPMLKIEQWRDQYLRTLWVAEDLPIDCYDDAFGPTAEQRPIIDPDVIGPDDFRIPDITNPAFAMWKKRRIWVDAQLLAFKTLLSAASSSPKIDALFSKMYTAATYSRAQIAAWRPSTPVSAFAGIYQSLTQDTVADAKSAMARLATDLRLSSDAFIRLMAVREKEVQGLAVEVEEWSDVVSILVQAQKTAFFQFWRTEEKSIPGNPGNPPGIEFGPRDFWVSITEPKEGAWPAVPLQTIYADSNTIPLIDPDLIKDGDLPDPTAGAWARALVKTRRDELLAIRLELQDKQRQSGFDAMILLALGDPAPGNPLPSGINLDTLRTDLQGTVPSIASTAETTINHQLHMSTDAFIRLMQIRDKDIQADPQKKPTPTEYADACAILLDAYKYKRKYARWFSDEQIAQKKYWQVLKAKLPRWRASAEVRQRWQQSLRLRSSSPLIDPDLVGAADIKSPVTQDPAFDLWRYRHIWVEGRITALKSMRESAVNPSAGLDAIIQQAIGVEHDIFWSMAAARDAGQSIAPRLGQWNLSIGAYDRLVRVRDLAVNSSAMPDEWDEVYSILVQAEKVRDFATWRSAEAATGHRITLSQDFFVLSLRSPGDTWQPTRWRATWSEHQDWQSQLKSRIEQEAAVREALVAAVSDTEKATLPILRDALLRLCNAAGTTFEAKADAIGNRFLIDMRAGGCHMTTRVAQAIETLQSLCQKIRMGLIDSELPQLHLAAPNFDEEWHWLGSFAMWRAAMFVYLYPENLLLPTLRKQQTPGFAKLLSDMRAIPRVTPETACQLARDYSDYFHDVCTLNVEACADATLELLRNNCGEGNNSSSQPVRFHFARTGSGQVYWTMRNKDSGAMGYWSKLDALPNASPLAGAVEYESPLEDRNLYLFALANDKGKQAPMLVKYDLKANKGWSAEAIPLDLPQGFSGAAGLKLKPTTRYVSPEFSIGEVAETLTHSAKLNPLGDALSASGYSQETRKYFYGDSVDISELDLESPHAKQPGDYSASDIALLMYEVNRYAIAKNSVGGIPTFFYTGGVFGAYMLYSDAVNIDYLSPAALNGQLKDWYSLDLNPIDFLLWMREANTYAQSKGYACGCPTFLKKDDKYGILLFKRTHNTSPPVNNITRLPPSALNNVATGDNIGAPDIVKRFREVANYIAKQNLPMGFPTFNDGTNPTNCEVVIFNHVAEETKLPQGPWLSSMSCGETVSGPTYKGQIDICNLRSGDNLTERRNRIESTYKSNAAGAPSHLTYFDEAWYFVPMLLAQKLRESGYYMEALDWYRTIYDYSGDGSNRLIYYGLELDRTRSTGTSRNADWLLDPLNPHLLAENRRYAYTRYTLFSIIQCLLEYADAEYTRDDAESVPRARELYETALTLLGAPELKQDASACETAIGALDQEVRGQLVIKDSSLLPLWVRIRASMSQWSDLAALLSLIANVRNKLFPATGIPILWIDRLGEAWALVESGPPAETTPTISDAIASLPGPIKELLNRFDAGQPVIPPVQAGYVPALSWFFCIPENPVRKALQLHAELNLRKMRHCRNIAGMERTLDAYAAPTDTTTGMPVLGAGGQLVLPGTRVLRPTPYRYAVLIERAKQMAQLAAQMENAMFSALEKRYNEAYGLLKARQDVQLVRANVRTQDLKLKEADDSTRLTELQRDRAQIQYQHYGQWLGDMGLGAAEGFALLAVSTAATLYWVIAYEETDHSKKLAASGQALAATAQALLQWTSLERRKHEWELARDIAAQDITIGNQQIAISQDRGAIVTQEKAVAELQRSHAEAVVDFLSNKFTNVELYEWMSNVLGQVYSFFLREATAMAKLAEGQLAFERHEVAPSYIQADYWDAPADISVVAGGKAPDRRGLTGSARLLQDIYQLDQYAFDRNKRKLELTETISLARIAPAEFQRFRETGVIAFRTPMELFDRKFPGHYLRLIKRVRASLVALIPPSAGIRATLTCNGLSRVVIGGDTYQTEVIRRAPESIALSSPTNATGLFELEPQGEMLLPFEGAGVDTAWEYRMPKAANPIDYSAVADLLITIEYTALDSYDYRQQVLQSLPDSVSGERPYSFRYEFADAWYDLNNSAQSSTPMVVRFQTRREDFPANLDSLKIEHVTLYFARADGVAFEVPVTALLCTPEKLSGEIGGGAKSVEGVISTRRGNAGSWVAMIGKSPVGQWQLMLPNTEVARGWFADEQILEILLVITYAGRTPQWPS